MTPLQQAAQALVDRWDTPLWKDAPHTGKYIDALRAALSAPAGWQAIETAPRDQTVLLWHKHYGRPTVGHGITGDIWGVYVPGTSMLFQPHLKDIPTHWMPLPAAPSPQEQT